MLAALMLASCAELGPLAGIGRTTPPDPKTQLHALEQRIYELVEKKREAINPKATPLQLDSELTSVARAHSEDMAEKHYLGHKSPSGQSAATIIMARDPNYQGLLGENIAAQYYTKEAGIDVDAYAKRFVQTWLNSKAHRENLAFSDYQRTGVGAAIDENEVFVTQLFSADLGLGLPAKKAPKGTDPRKVSLYPDPATAKAAEPPGHNVQLRSDMPAGMLPDEAPGSGPSQQ